MATISERMAAYERLAGSNNVNWLRAGDVNAQGRSGFLNTEQLRGGDCIVAIAQGTLITLYDIWADDTQYDAGLREIFYLTDTTVHEILVGPGILCFSAPKAVLVKGFIDKISHTSVLGWAKFFFSPDPVSVSLWCGAYMLREVKSDLIRNDLLEADYPTVAHGFEIPLGRLSLPDVDDLDIQLKETSTDCPISSSAFGGLSLSRYFGSISKQVGMEGLPYDARCLGNIYKRPLVLAANIVLVLRDLTDGSLEAIATALGDDWSCPTIFIVNASSVTNARKLRIVSAASRLSRNVVQVTEQAFIALSDGGNRSPYVAIFANEALRHSHLVDCLQYVNETAIDITSQTALKISNAEVFYGTIRQICSLFLRGAPYSYIVEKIDDTKLHLRTPMLIVDAEDHEADCILLWWNLIATRLRLGLAFSARISADAVVLSSNGAVLRTVRSTEPRRYSEWFDGALEMGCDLIVDLASCLDLTSQSSLQVCTVSRLLASESSNEIIRARPDGFDIDVLAALAAEIQLRPTSATLGYLTQIDHSAMPRIGIVQSLVGSWLEELIQEIRSELTCNIMIYQAPHCRVDQPDIKRTKSLSAFVSFLPQFVITDDVAACISDEIAFILRCGVIVVAVRARPGRPCIAHPLLIYVDDAKEAANAVAMQSRVPSEFSNYRTRYECWKRGTVAKYTRVIRQAFTQDTCR